MVTLAPGVSHVTLAACTFLLLAICKTHLMVTMPKYTHLVLKTQTIKPNQMLVPHVQRDPLIFLSYNAEAHNLLGTCIR